MRGAGGGTREAGRPVPSRSVRVLRLLGFGLTAAGAIFAGWTWAYWTTVGGNPADLRIYLTTPLSDPYSEWVLGAGDAYQYSPAFLQAIQPLAALPVEAAVAGWRAVLLAIVVLLAGPLTIPVLLWGPVASELNAGNVNLLIAAAIAAGYRWPAVWAFVLHTKITPAIGLLWFVVRGEWRKLGVVVSIAGGIALASAILVPELWRGWLILIFGNAASAAQVTTFPYWIPLSMRLPIAGLIVVLAARLGWKWAVAPAAMIAAPVLYFPTQAIVLGALPEVRRIATGWLERLLVASASPAQATASQPAELGAERDEVPPDVVGQPLP